MCIRDRSDPCRHARLKRVHWAFDGTPILKMTYDNELLDEYKTVSTTIQVKGKTVNVTKSEPEPKSSIIIPGKPSEPKSSVKISGKSSVKVGKKIKLKAVCKNLNAKKIKWKIKSGAKNIKLSVKKGKKVWIAGKKKGKAVIKIFCGGKTAKKVIKVRK